MRIKPSLVCIFWTRLATTGSFISQHRHPYIRHNFSNGAMVVTDPYEWLEEVESEASLNFARASNEKCLETLGDPTNTETYKRVLAVLESDDRIPSASSFGRDESGNIIVYNFWKDSTNPKGLWRRSTLDSYKTSTPDWEIILDLDKLAEKDGISWVWKGSRGLPRGRESGDSKQVTRALLSLSRGGSDAVFIREFDLLENDFVEDRPFNLPEAKTRISYKSRDVVLVGSDFGPDSLTDSGYPRTIREWIRGTDIKDAPVVFEGEKTDVSVYAYISDERVWNGGIYEVYGRSVTFYTSKYWVRRLLPEQLLASDDPLRLDVPIPPEFVELDVQDDADINFIGSLLMINLRSDWEPIPGQIFKKGSVIYTETDPFLESGSADVSFQILFEPTEKTSYEYFTLTKNYMILSILDTVKSSLQFYKIGDKSLTRVAGDRVAQIRDAGVRPLDPFDGSDEFWFTTSDFLTPTSLYLANASQATDEPESYITESLKSLPDQYDSSNLEVSQEFAISEDGTEIPYFIIKHKDTVLNGKNPTLLYGYGGFEVSLGPHYIATAGLAWLERGGVYVEANIRGGGEFGPAWHQAALKDKRHKAYEDFIAVAEDMIARKICHPKTLAIRGGSNGGLLVGNMYIMRPELFGAVHCAVPLLDMRKYHKLLAGASWMAEYGNPDTEDWENFLHRYSPYHNINPDQEYPPLLVTTSTRDDRVHPGHARKFVQKLWDLGKNVHYYENIEGGHGGAADAKQSAFMTALAYEFMFTTVSKNAEAIE